MRSPIDPKTLTMKKEEEKKKKKQRRREKFIFLERFPDGIPSSMHLSLRDMGGGDEGKIYISQQGNPASWYIVNKYGQME